MSGLIQVSVDREDYTPNPRYPDTDRLYKVGQIFTFSIEQLLSLVPSPKHKYQKYQIT